VKDNQNVGAVERLRELKEAQKHIQYEIDEIGGRTEKRERVSHSRSCRHTINPLIEALCEEEFLSVKPIILKVPEGVDVDEFIKSITGGTTLGADYPDEDYPDEDQKRFEEFKEACLPVLEFLNKYYNSHSYAVITEGRAEIVSGELGVPLPVRD
jgi:hypothetical protein